MIRSIQTAFIAALAALGAGTFATSAAAAVTSYDPATVIAALQNAGYKAKLSVDKEGDSKIESASEGNDISILFAGCTNGKSCDQVEFLAFWDCSENMKKCGALHVKWNEEELFSKSILVEKNIALYRHLLFDKAGISEELFIRNFVMFSNDAVSFMEKF